jgi:4'-phosphopantetheinyl transferase EntD
MVTLLDLIGKQSLASPLFSRRQSLFKQVFPENNRFYLFFQSATSCFTLL